MNLSEIDVTMHDGPLPPAPSWRVDGAGAVLCFEGIVRPQEEDQVISTLCYEEYPPMTQIMLEELARRMLEEHQLQAIKVQHSRGTVPVGEVSFRLFVAAAHRKEAIAAQDQFIDKMKQDVPLWKVPQWSGGNT